MGTITGCRSCGGAKLESILDLGQMPLADALLTAGQLAGEEPRFPLELAFCSSCSLVQILHTVPPEELFCRDYPYYSSFAQMVLDNARENAGDVASRWRLGAGSLVVELASNDGYLLKNFVAMGVPVLGIDPAEGPAREAV